MPQSLSTQPRSDNALGALEAEFASERAQSLGRAGREVQASLAALSAAAGGDPARPHLVRTAAKAVWGYFVQREACGLIDHDQPIADYAIPAEVLARVGAID